MNLPGVMLKLLRDWELLQLSLLFVYIS